MFTEHGEEAWASTLGPILDAKLEAAIQEVDEDRRGASTSPEPTTAD